MGDPNDDATYLKIFLRTQGFSHRRWALEMRRLGDHRDTEVIIRANERMAAGESSMSGEMMALCGAYLEKRKALGREVMLLPWIRQPDGGERAVTGDGFEVRITPYRVTRWWPTARHVMNPDLDIPYPGSCADLAEARLAAVEAIWRLRDDPSPALLKATTDFYLGRVIVTQAA